MLAEDERIELPAQVLETRGAPFALIPYNVGGERVGIEPTLGSL